MADLLDECHQGRPFPAQVEPLLDGKNDIGFRGCGNNSGPPSFATYQPATIGPDIDAPANSAPRNIRQTLAFGKQSPLLVERSRSP